MSRRRAARAPFTTSTVTSADGTTIGCRRYGQGPGVVLVHGGMMSGRDLDALAVRLASALSVIVPDLRGRGRSGAIGEGHSVRTEVEDLAAVLDATGARGMFGVSAGAVFVLEAALELRAVERVAVYEPPFPLTGEVSTTGWLPEYELQVAAGDLGGALVTVARGTGDTSPLRWLPRAVTGPFMNSVIRAQAVEIGEDDVSLRELILSIGPDAAVIASTRDRLSAFRELDARVLLMRGTRSPDNLRAPIDDLHDLLPEAEYWVLQGAGHLAVTKRRSAGAVARRLEQFFTAASVEQPHGGLGAPPS